MKNRFLMILFLGIFILSFSTGVLGATINAVSCEQVDVQSAIDSAVDGDTVLVPAGECTWGAGVSFSKSIELQGAGISQTIITADDSGFLSLITSTGDNAVVTGFYLKSPLTSPHVIWIQGDNWRVHHNKVECITANQKVVGVMAKGYGGKVDPIGLVDNNIFLDARVTSIATMVLLTGGDTQNEIWAKPLGLGGSSTVYIEDNIFTTTVGGNVIDGNYASSYVARFNTITMPGWGSHFEAHSMQSIANRAHRRWEIYGNTVTGIGKWVPMFIRGGTGVIFNNSLFGSFTTEKILFDNVRSVKDVGGTAGPCNGSSLWDGNQDATGWPCRDQIGRGPDLVQWENDPPATYTQTFVPAYIWSNLDTSGGELTASVVNGCGDHIKANRDYYEDVTSFDGTTGVGVGTLANRPATCTSGVGYWVTDQGEWNSKNAGPDGQLFKCTSTNNWELYYTPYTYPHPLALTGDCGNGNCDAGECNICPSDCSFSDCCPDGTCNNGENCGTCPLDCPSDVDGDTYDSIACGGTDCDDNNINVNPEATEICDNVVDDDCDTQIDCADADCSSLPICQTLHICEDIKLLMHFDEDSSIIQDFSGNGNDGTVSGATFTSSGKFSGAFDYDGLDDVITTNTVAFDSNVITVSFWVNAGGWAVSTPAEEIIGSGTVANGWKIYSYYNDICAKQYGTATWNSRGESVAAPSTNSWNHIVVMFDASTVAGENRIFYNGVEKSTNVPSNNKVGSGNFAARAVTIGDASNDFDGLIDEVAIWNRALTSDEILNLYNGGQPISCTASTTCSSADTDTDGVVDIIELMDYISDWKAGSVTITELMTGIGEWKNGCS